MMDLITMFLYIELTKWWWYFKYEIIQVIPIGTNTKKGAKGAIVLSKDAFYTPHQNMTFITMFSLEACSHRRYVLVHNHQVLVMGIITWFGQLL